MQPLIGFLTQFTDKKHTALIISYVVGIMSAFGIVVPSSTQDTVAGIVVVVVTALVHVWSSTSTVTSAAHEVTTATSAAGPGTVTVRTWGAAAVEAAKKPPNTSALTASIPPQVTDPTDAQKAATLTETDSVNAVIADYRAGKVNSTEAIARLDELQKADPGLLGPIIATAKTVVTGPIPAKAA